MVISCVIFSIQAFHGVLQERFMARAKQIPLQLMSIQAGSRIQERFQPLGPNGPEAESGAQLLKKRMATDSSTDSFTVTGLGKQMLGVDTI